MAKLQSTMVLATALAAMLLAPPVSAQDSFHKGGLDGFERRSAQERPRPPPFNSVNLYKGMISAGDNPYARFTLQQTIGEDPYNLDIKDCGSKGFTDNSLQWHGQKAAIKADKNAARLCQSSLLYPLIRAEKNSFYVGVVDQTVRYGWDAAEKDGKYTPRLIETDPLFTLSQQFEFHCQKRNVEAGGKKYWGQECLLYIKRSSASRQCLRALDWKDGGNNLKGPVDGATCNPKDPMQLWAIENVAREFTNDNHKMSGKLSDIPAPPGTSAAATR